MIEIYPACSSAVLSPGFLTLLDEGWSAAFDHLQNLGVGEIVELSGMEITLLDDAEMSRLHGEFLEDATPTDVITFAHGELLIGVETAERQAKLFGSDPAREIALYGIHGMLHLAGFDDQDENEAQTMSERQFELLGRLFPSL